MQTGKSDLTELSGLYRHETEEAWLIDFGENDPTWLPKSQCEIEEENDGTVTVTLPEWLAIEKGLV